MHLDDELIQRFLHREVPPQEEVEVSEHLSVCAACGARVAAADGEETRLFALLRAVDHPPPRITSAEIMRRARGRNPMWMRAAGILVVLGLAGVAYAAPGSPLRDFVAGMFSPPGEAPATSPAARAPARAAGIAVPPTSRFTIVIDGEPVNGIARVSVDDGSEVVVRTVDGSAVFTAGIDRVLIGDIDASTTLDIVIPRAAPWVEVRLRDRRVFLKEGAAIVAMLERDGSGRYLLQLSSAAAAR